MTSIEEIYRNYDKLEAENRRLVQQNNELTRRLGEFNNAERAVFQYNMLSRVPRSMMAPLESCYLPEADGQSPHLRVKRCDRMEQEIEFLPPSC